MVSTISGRREKIKNSNKISKKETDNNLAGLGGTSLINANIFLRADETTMGTKAWPPELREKGVLDECEYIEYFCLLSPPLFPDLTFP